MSGGRNRLPVLSATVLALVVSVLFYGWTVESSRSGLEFQGPKQDYYNLLARGFRKGHLSMDVAPDPALLALPSNERPGNAPFLLDASLYRDRYYLYFGVVPPALLYLPYASLTGQGIPEAGAALIFASAGLVFSVLWWLDVRRRFFPTAGAIWTLVSVLGIAIGSAVPSTLRRPLFYEVAITAGYAFMMLALWAFTRARWATGSRRGWLILGAVAAGLAVGSRANLGPACLALVIGGAAAAATGRKRGVAPALLASGLAFGAVIAALGAYNAARFGNPLEFGHSYQLGVEPNRLFHQSNFEHNAAIYYLRPPALNGYFPFVAPAAEPVKPDDYVGRENAHGEWVWLPLAFAALGALIWRSAHRPRPGPDEALGVLAVPAGMFAVNFIVTASVGVRANRYMLDFHPMLVLVVVAALGLVLTGPGWPRRMGALAAGAGILAAAAFNLFGSLQAQGFFRATDPIAYSRIASVADRVVWPFLCSKPAVGDRVVRLRWPARPRQGASEPICAAGSPGYDDVLWVEYGSAGKARFAYQYWEYGRAYGRWFVIEPGKTSEIRISGALLLPRAGHPWFGDRPREQQDILKRSLSVSVDGVTRFERDVPSHDSSPRLQRWGAWRHADGVEYAFSGTVADVRDESVQDRRALRSVTDQGSVRLRLELPPQGIGRFEPILQSGTPGSFDTLVVHYVRPGFIQLVHDQLGSGARWSREFAVDYSRPQQVDVELPFADDQVDWLAGGPAFRNRPTGRMKVTWNGRVVFEPEVPPMPAERPDIVLGANLLHSSVAQAMFGGILETEPARRRLGPIGEGSLTFQPDRSGAFGDERGILVRFDRDDGEAAGLAWRQADLANRIFLGWVEGGNTAWSNRPVDARHARTIVEDISREGGAIGDRPRPASPDSSGRFVVEVGRVTVVAQRTSFFSKGAVRAEGAGDGEWSGTALWQAPRKGRAGSLAAIPPTALPGGIRFTFRMPDQGRISSSPVLEAGRVGAADSIYLRGLSGGRYVIGLDHWAEGATESAPFSLAAGEIHAIGIEMSSLGSIGTARAGAVRISLDGRVVMDRLTALYPALPGEIFFGANPLGMSTSAAEFEGDFISVRTQQAESDLIGKDP